MSRRAFTLVELPAVSRRAFTLVELPAVSRRAFTLVELPAVSRRAFTLVELPAVTRRAFTLVELPAVSRRAFTLVELPAVSRRAFTLVELPAVSRRAFTLVELLVVVAIIGLLLSIIMPAMARVREQAEFVACRSNLKQIGTAAFTYAHDYDGAIPFGPGQSAINFLDFYRFPGMVTSLAATTSGHPVGLGLAVESYLGSNPQVIFCPGSDQKIIAADELAKFGSAQVQTSYWYRHGSAAYPGDPVLNIKLGGEYENRLGEPLRLIAMDTNFIAHPQAAAYNIYTRTHHDGDRVNALALDASVGGLTNDGEQFTVDPGSSLTDGPDLMLDAFENADRIW